jgi:hypothetical protein|uniref:Uncharacterized protein n=1 Tax=Siphoviridae sp. ctQtc11 TaxID=2825497 RepID=A0A8S5P387_9CAUD|nr:MAG TPA: hypothetical protein [Siphoviridae sp. ctQtc11]
MSKVKITFSNNETVILKDGDHIVPIDSLKTDEERLSSMAKPVYLENNFHNGLIPSITEVTCNYDFFYINDNHDIVYGTKTIVKIESI